MASDGMNDVERAAHLEQVLEGSGQFWGWLQARAGEVAGFPCNCEGCPLAFWLDEVMGGDWLVSPSRCGDGRGWVSASLPAWAQAFVEEVDRRYGWRVSVTGHEALAVLREVVC